MEPGGSITIATQVRERSEVQGLEAEGLDGEAQKDQRFACVQVSDDGCGMDAETIKRACDPFFTTKARDKGTGLGLATVFGIVQQNNGGFDIDSEPGRGTRLSICFPLEERESEALLPGGESKVVPRGHECILLVEDEPAVLQLGVQILSKLGYDVVSADSPKKAIEIGRELGPRLSALVTDVVMPECNGHALWEELHRDLPELRCLFVSGYDERRPDPAEARDAGCRFLAKPYTSLELAHELRSLLDERLSGD